MNSMMRSQYEVKTWQGAVPETAPRPFNSGVMSTDNKPTTHQGDLAKLPPALAPLVARPQWCIWRWTRKPGGSWQKPPFMATNPERNASSTDPSTWTDYTTALAAVQAGHGNGVTYVLTENDPFAAIDLDHCRDADTRSIDAWAQKFLARSRIAYAEITPSGDGLRIWGSANGAKVHRAFTLEIDEKSVKAELFRRTNKPLTITGLELVRVRELTGIDQLVDWAVIWAERRKAAEKPVVPIKGDGLNGDNGSGYSIDEIEAIVRAGAPAGANRSDTFHTIVGHYIGCGWDPDQILAHLGQFPNGIGERYLSEGRLSGEIARSIGKYTGSLPQLDVDAWRAKTLQPELNGEPNTIPGNGGGNGAAGGNGGVATDNLGPPWEGLKGPEDPELLDEDPELDEETKSPDLPPLYAHGDLDERPLKSWTIKHLIPTCGHGLLSGQWGAGKTFVVFDLAGAVITGQPWLGHSIKRQCGVLLIAAEGGDEVRLRLDAMVRAKCGGMQRAPFRWYETMPVLLLHKDATAKLVAMAEQAEASLQAEFGLPLGLIVIDTIAASAGYQRHGGENDNATAQAIMNVLKNLAQKMDCFVLGVDHFGKNIDSGTRGADAKEASADLVLACLAEKETSGRVTDTRVAVRKSRGGPQGQEHYFALEKVAAPEPDEDGELIETMVVNWQSGPPGETGGRPAPDPWAESRRQDQKTAMLRLKRVLMSVLAEQGVELPIAPDGPTARMVDQEIVRKSFYVHTPAEGTPEQKGEFRRKRFNRAVDWAEDQQLIAIAEIDGVTYLRLTHPDQESGADV